MKRDRRRLAGWLGGVLAALVAGAAWLRLGPIDESLLDPNRHQSLVVLDRNGEVLYEPLASTGVGWTRAMARWRKPTTASSSSPWWKRTRLPAALRTSSAT